MTNESDQLQPYDSTLKALVQAYAKDILPFLLEGVTFVEMLNVELLRPSMRVDRVFKVMYRKMPHVLHLEFESTASPFMDARLLAYHGILYDEYHLPIISMIIYPFKVKMAEPPFQEMSGPEELLRFHYKVLPLWLLDAESYVKVHAVCMYALLPTMQGVTDELLLQAMKELTEQFNYDETLIARQFVWMGIMLRRSTTMSPQDKRKIKKELSMYDRLWDEDPEIRRIKAEAEARGKAAGIREAKEEAKRLKEEIKRRDAEAKAEIKRREAEAKEETKRREAEAKEELKRREAEAVASQEIIVEIVKARFPPLAELAQRQVKTIGQPEALGQLARQIATAPDEATARWVLGTAA